MNVIYWMERWTEIRKTWVQIPPSHEINHKPDIGHFSQLKISPVMVMKINLDKVLCLEEDNNENKIQRIQYNMLKTQ